MNETLEYLEIMAGRKRLELEYKTGEIVSGYTAFGLHAKIIESLHCGQYVDGWGFLVDREFEDGDIHRMKRHFFEWKEMHEIQKTLEEEARKKEIEEKEKLLAGVSWKQEEHLELYGGISYKHYIQIEENEFIFEEKKISGMGRVILPLYEICKDAFDTPLPECIDGKWCWSYIQAGKEQKLPMSSLEERAFIIVYQYGLLL